MYNKSTKKISRTQVLVDEFCETFKKKITLIS